MFVIVLRYVKPLEDVDRVLKAHVEFVDRYYAEGNFICSGRQNPRLGGVILCNAGSRDEVECIVTNDPFNQEGIAEYTIIEFNPSRFADGFERFVSTPV